MRRRGLNGMGSGGRVTVRKLNEAVYSHRFYVSFAIQTSRHRPFLRAADRHRRIARWRNQRPGQSIPAAGTLVGSFGSATSSLPSPGARGACAPGEHRSRKTRLPGGCAGVACPTAACGDRHPRRGPILRTGSDRSGGQDRAWAAGDAATERRNYDCRFRPPLVRGRTRSYRDRARFTRRWLAGEGPLLMSALPAGSRLGPARWVRRGHPTGGGPGAG